MATTGNVLEARITADISDLQSKLKTADGLLTGYAGKISSVQQAIRKNVNSSRDFQQSLERLNNEFKEGTISQERYEKESRDLQNSYGRSQREIRDLQRELDRLQREQKQAENTTEKLNAEIASTPRATQQAAQATQTLGRNMKKTGSVVRGTTPTLTSFSQVIQDAPYGIQGVANNIQQLTAQFGYMSQRAGGATGAMKSLVAGLAGPAGILLAVSALTSLLVSYGPEILDFIKNTSDAEKAQRKLNEAMGGAVAETRATALEMQTLNGIIQTSNNDLQTQKKAYDRLNEVAPELTENYSLQQIAAGKATDAIKDLTDAMLRQAELDAALDVIKETEEELFELENSLGAATAGFWDYIAAAKNFPEFSHFLEMYGAETGRERIKDLTEELERFKDSYRDSLSEDVTTGGSFGIFNNEDAIAAGKAAEEALEQSKKNAEKRNAALLKAQKERAKIRIGGRKAEQEMQELLLQDETAFANEMAALYDIDYGSLSNIGDGLKDSLPQIERFQELVKELQETLGEGFTGAGYSIEQLEQLARKMETLAEVSSVVEGAVTSAFSTMSTQLVDSLGLADNALGSFVGSIIQSVLKIIAVKLAGAIANAIFGATEFGASTGAAAPIVIPATIASLTGVVQGAFNSIPSFAQGGIVPGGSYIGDRVPIYANSGEMILNGGQQQQLFKMFDSRMGNIGNNEPLKIEVVGQISGENIKLASDRYSRGRNRIN